MGYFLEVDLEYPQSLHDTHNDYPFCPERLSMNEHKKNTKLILNLNDKKNYVLHYRTLKMVLSRGLKLKGVGKIIKFNQSQWLYIDLNTKERINAKNEFEKELYKLMSDAIYGKTIENVKNRVNIILIDKWNMVQRH